MCSAVDCFAKRKHVIISGISMDELCIFKDPTQYKQCIWQLHGIYTIICITGKKS